MMNVDAGENYDNDDRNDDDDCNCGDNNCDVDYNDLLWLKNI